MNFDLPSSLIETDPELRDAAVLVYRFRSGFQDPVNGVNMGLRSFVTSEGAPVVVAQRLKRLPTIFTKLARLPKMQLSRMQDIGGCRAILPSRRHVEGVAGRIASNWDVRRFDDYVVNPKPVTGYRAVHVVVNRRGRQIEIQLRTPLQQRWASEVDRAAGRLNVQLKDGIGPQDLVEEYARLAETIAQRGDEPAAEDVDVAFAALREKVLRHAPAK
jgi:ppGpp synthetase/RelA/SpoT-type nucleotidyltranferase